MYNKENQTPYVYPNKKRDIYIYYDGQEKRDN